MTTITQASLDLEISQQMPSGAKTTIAVVRQVLHDMNAAIFQNGGPLTTPANGTVPIGTSFGTSNWGRSFPLSLNIADLTDATSAVTGALTIAGGLGIAKNVFSGGGYTSNLSGVSGLFTANVAGITYVGSFSNHPVGLIANNAEIMRGFAGIQFGAPTGGDKGLGTLNFATGIYANNILIVDSFGNSYGPGPVTLGGTTGTIGGTVGSTSCIINASGTFSLGLPNPVTNLGRWLHIKAIANFPVNSTSSNVCPIGSATPGTAILSGVGKWTRLQSDGTNWITMQAN